MADTGGPYAIYDRNDAHHDAVIEAVARETGQLVVPSVVLAELDYLLLEYLGPNAEIDFLSELQRDDGRYRLEHLTSLDLSIATKTIVKYRALSLGIVDAGVMAVAERLDVARILTVDQQHFRAVTPNRRDWQHDTLVPFDELDAV